MPDSAPPSACLCLENPVGLVSYFRESLQADFPRDLAQKDRLVLALHAYFDDSGTHAGSEAVTVAGYISTVEQWDMFTREWAAVLAEWGLGCFHMTDFANKVGKYREWSDQERRFRFGRLVSIINRHAIASVGIGIPKQAFDQIFPKNAKRFVGGAYGLAATACFFEAARILEPGYPSARIAYFFEAGTRGSGEILKVFNWNYNDREQRPKLKLISIKFEGKEFPPLQAADILAYELYRRIPFDLGIQGAVGPRMENWNLLSDCKLRAWGRLEDAELFKWAQIVAASAIHNAPRSRLGGHPKPASRGHLKTGQLKP